MSGDKDHLIPAASGNPKNQSDFMNTTPTLAASHDNAASPASLPMDTLSFLRKILPEEGDHYYCMAEFRNGLDNPPKHKYAKTVSEIASIIARADSSDFNTFHANATFITNESRKQTNTACMKSFWLDLDVKDGQYASQSEAAAAVADFVFKLDLPMPMIVKSGRGLHCYWTLDANITSADWKATADRLALCLTHVGVKHDPSCTTDQARVLRPVGTHHRKAAPILVTLLRDAGPCEFAEFKYQIDAYADEHALFAALRKEAPTKSALSCGMEPNYPPSSGAEAAHKCAAMAEIRDTQGDAPYMQWRNVIGVLKHCTDGAKLAESWTELREQTGHSNVDWQKQWDSWNAGPTTCEQMSKERTACKDCAYFGKVVSPIKLGFAEAKPITEADIPDWVARMNEDHAQVLLGGKYVIFLKNAPVYVDGRVSVQPQYIDQAAFKSRLAGQMVQLNGKEVPKAGAWLNHAQRRQYNAATFAPSEDTGVIYNLWKGWAVEASAGVFTPWLDLLRSMVPNREEAEHIVKWFAWKIQNPGKVPGTVLILSGGKGCGKNSIVEPFLKMFGPHGAIYDNPEQIVGRFNFHLMDKSFIVTDEIVITGNLQHSDAMKSRITGNNMTFEPKGLGHVSGINRAAYVMLTNHQWAWQASNDERRPIVVTLSDVLTADRAFWKCYYEWLDGGGAAALLHYLQTLELGNFDVRRIPKTAALAQQVEQTLLREPGASWWHSILVDGSVATRGSNGMHLPLNEDEPTEISKYLLRESFDSRSNNKTNFDTVMKSMRRWTNGELLTRRPSTGASRQRVYVLPPLNALRNYFTSATGISFESAVSAAEGEP